VVAGSSGSASSGRDIHVVVFDLDGTLLDSDAALLAAFEALGVDAGTVTYGHAVAEEAERLGLSLGQYEAAYDTEVAQPFAGVEDLLAQIDRWAICSNKHPESALAELDRLGWSPEVACFADAFDWEHKRLDPVLDALGVASEEVVMIGDTSGDALVAEAVGCDYLWAGWNPRTRAAAPVGQVLDSPAELLDWLRARPRS
jgi:HAD superfamily hydrolase (TIGR01549 family)